MRLKMDKKSKATTVSHGRLGKLATQLSSGAAMQTSAADSCAYRENSVLT